MIGDRNGAESDGCTGTDDEQAVAAKDLFDILSNPSRRRVLRGLHETDGRVCLHEFADRLVDRRTDRLADGPTERPADQLADSSDDDRTERPTEDPDRLAIRLHHSHLPKLDDCGLADYDAESHTVVAEIPAWVEPYLDAAQ